MSALIFGKFWDAPVCEDAISVSTPIGVPCFQCEEAIEDGDRGLLMSVVREDASGEPVARFEPIHRECHLRSVVGSYGHLIGTCSCSGGDEEDPPGLTRRQSANLVWKVFTERGLLELLRAAEGQGLVRHYRHVGWITGEVYCGSCGRGSGWPCSLAYNFEVLASWAAKWLRGRSTRRGSTSR